MAFFKVFHCICIIVGQVFVCACIAAGEEVREPVALKVLPEHVGVFYELGKQQFTAIASFADGTEEDYTDKVGWSIEAYPFSKQTTPPEQVATIDQHGLAKVLTSWGRVSVQATYPPPQKIAQRVLNILLLKPPPPEPEPEPKPAMGFLPAIYLLLLSDDPVIPDSWYPATPTAKSDVSTSIAGSEVAKTLNLVPFERNLPDSFH